MTITRSTLLGRLNKLLADTPKTQTNDTTTGDGSTTVFSLGDYPIVDDGSIVVTVGGSTLTEDTGYTVDYENALITFTTAPANGSAIVTSFKNSYFSNQAKVDYINEALTTELATETTDNLTSASSSYVIADMSETWKDNVTLATLTGGTTATKETSLIRTGTQALKLSRHATGQNELMLIENHDLKGIDDDKIVTYVYASDSSCQLTVTFYNATTANYAYHTSDSLSEGWNRVELPRSDFTEATTDFDWGAIAAVNLEGITTTADPNSFIVVDQLLLVREDEYTHVYNLPSDNLRILDVYLYDSSGNAKKRIRRYDLEGDKIYINDALPKGQFISVRYLKAFSELSTDASTTTLPDKGLMAPVYYAASCLIRDREVVHARFDELPNNMDENRKQQGSQLNTATYYYKKFEQVRNQANLNPHKRSGSTAIRSN